MKTLMLAAAALSLGACATPFANDFATVKLQAAGANFSPTTGFTAGYLGSTGAFTPLLTKDGKTLFTVGEPCGQADAPATYANLNSKAQASATSTGGAAGGVAAPSVAWASGDTSATGAAARVLALGGGQAPPTPEALDAYQHCPGAAGLPAASAGAVVQQGVAPK